MKKLFARTIAFLIILLLASILGLSFYSAVRENIAKNLLGKNDLIVSEALPTIHGDVKIIAYNFDKNATSTRDSIKVGHLIWIDRSSDEIIVDQLVRQGDKISAGGSEIEIREINFGLLTTSRGFMILSITHISP